VLILTLLLLLLFLVVSGFFAAWSLWFQGYIYSEPAPVLPWRAPAAGAAVAAFVALWVLLVAKSHGNLATLTDFSASQTEEYKDVWLTDPQGNELPEQAHYQLVPGQNQYRLNGQVNGKQMPSRPQGLKVQDKDRGDKTWFKPDRDEKGNFKVEQVSGIGGSSAQSLKYRDDKGRVMEEGQLGRVTKFRWGWLFANLLLNALHLVVWWLALWLLLRFQWSHALGQAIVLWLVATLFVLPPLFSRAA
jgi:hypothetical protein